jgi:hypothetical protein
LNSVDADDEPDVDLNLVDAGVDLTGVELGFELVDFFFGSHFPPIRLV